MTDFFKVKAVKIHTSMIITLNPISSKKKESVNMLNYPITTVNSTPKKTSYLIKKVL